MIRRDTQKKESSFERKLKDIEREKRRVQHEIKSLSRAMKKGEWSPSAANGPRVPLREKLGSRADDVAPESDARQEKTAKAETAGDLFSWNSGNKEPVPAREPQRKESLSSPLVAEKKKPVYGDERFGNYFSAGGFKSPVSRQERSIQRNKAIFMIVLVIVVGYIIFTVLIR